MLCEKNLSYMRKNFKLCEEKIIKLCVKKQIKFCVIKIIEVKSFERKEHQVQSFTHAQNIKIHDVDKSTSCRNRTHDFQFMRLTLYQLN